MHFIYRNIFHMIDQLPNNYRLHCPRLEVDTLLLLKEQQRCDCYLNSIVHFGSILVIVLQTIQMCSDWC